MKRTNDDSNRQIQKRLRQDEISRIFVGGLSYATNWQSLKDHFSQIGEVEFASVLLKPDGTSKGCGMVNYRSHADAAQAVEALNESLLDGRHIMVKLDLGGDFKKPQQVDSNSSVHSAKLSSGQSAPKNIYAFCDDGVHLPPEQISRIFVGNLSYSTTWQGLKDHFKEAGTVEFASVLENPNKTSKGCGMVNFATHEEAVKAVALLNDSTLDGRQITVKLDVDGRFKERPPPKGAVQTMPDDESLFYSMPPEQICRVFVGNLSYDTNWQALKDHFAQAGEIEFASVLLNPDRTSKGCGMVNFRSHEDATRAVDLLNNSFLDGRQVTVKLDIDGRFKERPPPGARPRVFQRPRSSESWVGALQAPLQTLRQSIKPGHHSSISGTRLSSGTAQQVQKNLLVMLSQLARSPDAANLDWLALLGQVAQMPGADQLDWPALISRVASAAQQTSRGNQNGFLEQAVGHLLR